MGERSRMGFIIVIALILAAAVIYSFTVGVFQRTPDVGFAEQAPVGSGEATHPAPFGNMVRISVEPDTVQNVIRSLDRYASYRRTLSVEYLEGDTVTGALTVSAAVDGGWMRCDVTENNGRTEHTILGDGFRWLWYDDETEYVQVRTDRSASDLLQRVPTYEDVLELEAQRITAAGYELRGGLPCIYVEVSQPELGYLERFWVSVESGLLVASETVKDGEAVYRMSSYEVESPLYEEEDGAEDGQMAGEGDDPSFPVKDAFTFEDTFTLPDGTVLHQVRADLASPPD